MPQPEGRPAGQALQLTAALVVERLCGLDGLAGLLLAPNGHGALPAVLAQGVAALPGVACDQGGEGGGGGGGEFLGAAVVEEAEEEAREEEEGSGEHSGEGGARGRPTAASGGDAALQPSPLPSHMAAWGEGGGGGGVGARGRDEEDTMRWAAPLERAAARPQVLTQAPPLAAPAFMQLARGAAPGALQQGPGGSGAAPAVDLMPATLARDPRREPSPVAPRAQAPHARAARGGGGGGGPRSVAADPALAMSGRCLAGAAAVPAFARLLALGQARKEQAGDGAAAVADVHGYADGEQPVADWGLAEEEAEVQPGQHEEAYGEGAQEQEEGAGAEAEADADEGPASLFDGLFAALQDEGGGRAAEAESPPSAPAVQACQPGVQGPAAVQSSKAAPTAPPSPPATGNTQPAGWAAQPPASAALGPRSLPRAAPPASRGAGAGLRLLLPPALPGLRSRALTPADAAAGPSVAPPAARPAPGAPRPPASAGAGSRAATATVPQPVPADLPLATPVAQAHPWFKLSAPLPAAAAPKGAPALGRFSLLDPRRRAPQPTPQLPADPTSDAQDQGARAAATRAGKSSAWDAAVEAFAAREGGAQEGERQPIGAQGVRPQAGAAGVASCRPVAPVSQAGAAAAIASRAVGGAAAAGGAWAAYLDEEPPATARRSSHTPLPRATQQAAAWPHGTSAPQAPAFDGRGKGLWHAAKLARRAVGGGGKLWVAGGGLAGTPQPPTPPAAGPLTAAARPAATTGLSPTPRTPAVLVSVVDALAGSAGGSSGGPASASLQRRAAHQWAAGAAPGPAAGAHAAQRSATPASLPVAGAQPRHAAPPEAQQRGPARAAAAARDAGGAAPSGAEPGGRPRAPDYSVLVALSQGLRKRKAPCPAQPPRGSQAAGGAAVGVLLPAAGDGPHGAACEPSTQGWLAEEGVGGGLGGERDAGAEGGMEYSVDPSLDWFS